MCNHHVVIEKYVHLSQPESITLLLEKELTIESIACCGKAMTISASGVGMPLTSM